MGAIEARNKLIDDALIKYKVCHDKHFPNGRSLTDDEWQTYINEMDAIAEGYKKTNIAGLTGELCMAFLNDTEMVHKKWLEMGK